MFASGEDPSSRSGPNRTVRNSFRSAPITGQLPRSFPASTNKVSLDTVTEARPGGAAGLVSTVAQFV